MRAPRRRAARERAHAVAGGAAPAAAVGRAERVRAGRGSARGGGCASAVPLLFELRDTAGLPVAGHEVALSVTNGWLGAARVVTDSSGRVHVDVTLGPHVGPVAVKAQAEAIERQVASNRSGKGHEAYQEIAGTRVPFSDREVARAALGEREASR